MRLPGSHIPAQIHPAGLIELPNRIHTPPGKVPDLILVSLDKHRVGGQIPPEQNILRVFEKMGHKMYIFVSPNVVEIPKEYMHEVYAEYRKVVFQNANM